MAPRLAGAAALVVVGLVLTAGACSKRGNTTPTLRVGHPTAATSTWHGTTWKPPRTDSSSPTVANVRITKLDAAPPRGRVEVVLVSGAELEQATVRDQFGTPIPETITHGTGGASVAPAKLEFDVPLRRNGRKLLRRPDTATAKLIATRDGQRTRTTLLLRSHRKPRLFEEPAD